MCLLFLELFIQPVVILFSSLLFNSKSSTSSNCYNTRETGSLAPFQYSYFYLLDLSSFLCFQSESFNKLDDKMIGLETSKHLNTDNDGYSDLTDVNKVNCCPIEMRI
jgi:hypothetical protein